MAAIRNNQKKDWNSQETRLVFAHGEVLKDKSRNFAIFKMNLFAKTVNSRAYNQWTVITKMKAGIILDFIFQGFTRIAKKSHPGGR